MSNEIAMTNVGTPPPLPARPSISTTNEHQPGLPPRPQRISTSSGSSTPQHEMLPSPTSGTIQYTMLPSPTSVTTIHVANDAVAADYYGRNSCCNMTTKVLGIIGALVCIAVCVAVPLGVVYGVVNAKDLLNQFLPIPEVPALPSFFFFMVQGNVSSYTTGSPVLSSITIGPGDYCDTTYPSNGRYTLLCSVPPSGISNVVIPVTTGRGSSYIPTYVTLQVNPANDITAFRVHIPLNSVTMTRPFNPANGVTTSLTVYNRSVTVTMPSLSQAEIDEAKAPSDALLRLASVPPISSPGVMMSSTADANGDQNLQSGGMFWFELTDRNGASWSPPASSPVQFSLAPLTMNKVSNNPGSWYQFNTQSGMWDPNNGNVQSSSRRLMNLGNEHQRKHNMHLMQTNFVASALPGFWNYDFPYPATCVTGRVVMQGPCEGCPITLDGIDGVSMQTISQKNGSFCFSTPQDRTGLVRFGGVAPRWSGTKTIPIRTLGVAGNCGQPTSCLQMGQVDMTGYDLGRREDNCPSQEANCAIDLNGWVNFWIPFARECAGRVNPAECCPSVRTARAQMDRILLTTCSSFMNDDLQQLQDSLRALQNECS